MLFLGLNVWVRSIEFNIKVGNEIVKNLDKVVEILVDYFVLIVDGIGGDNIENLMESDFNNYLSVFKIV